MIRCPSCGIDYESPSEQSVCMAFFGRCIGCEKHSLTEDDLLDIKERADSLRKAQEK